MNLFMKNKILRYVPWLFLLIMIEPSFRRSTLNIFPTFVTFSFQTLFIILAFYTLRKLHITHKRGNSLLKITAIWIFICIARGFFLSESYWDLKNCYTNSLGLLCPFSAILFAHPYFTQTTLQKYFIWIFPISILAIPFFSTWSWFWMYYTFFTFILFFPALRRYWIFLFISIFFASIDVTARSVLLKVSIAIILGCLLYFNKFIRSKIFQFITYGVYIITFTLLYLGITGTFNIFQMDKYMPKTLTKDEELTQDTRTLLYTEAISSAINNNYIIWGRTPARGYDTSFAPIEDELWKRAKISGDNINNLHMERNAEVCFLNIFTWTGLVGVVLISLIYIMATHRALTRSQNDFVRLAGLYIAFRYMYGWIEDTLTFNGNILCLWIIIGICYSPYFQNMTNNEFRQFIRNSIKLPI